MHLTEIGLALLEGVGLILSPCILPVLPLVLSSAADGGRGRPFGIIAGFITAFSLFVLGSRELVTALHVNLDVIKYGSLILLALFGVVLLSERLSLVFSRLTQGATALGERQAAGGGGFWSGLAIGSLIGFIWTPCAGPILAAVLVQVIRQQTDLQGVVVTVAFAVGASLPMLLIALTGRKFMSKVGFFTRHAETVRKGFGVIILCAVAYMAFGAFSVGDIPNGNTEVVANDSGSDKPLQLESGLKAPYPAPEFAGISTWLNSSPLTMQDLKGKVVLIDFWTYSCINCVRTLPYITSWYQKYHDKGLVIIGVHSPEFEFEKNPENIKEALKKYGIDYPVAVDNELATWVNFKNKYWPAHYLIDTNGQVVYTQFGEGHYDVTENNIRFLLKLQKGQPSNVTSTMPVNFGQTNETYLGSDRAARFEGKPSLKSGDATYHFPGFIPQSSWSLDGRWKVQGQKIISGDKGSALRFNFNARRVFLVMGTTGNKSATLRLKLNGEDIGPNAGKDVTDGAIKIAGHTLYELVDQKTSSNSLLELTTDQPGVELYAFTFGG